ncbi:hypothetical protein AAA294_07240 [Fusobacterium varium]|uniref:hypothetical protein n=1 Tax=Fusobacterium varium TaxID=856 RepID=UPI0032C00F1E
MEIKDFKEMTKKHAESCQKLIKQNGSCTGVICEHCPFYFENTVNGVGCYEYTDQEYNPETEKDKILIKNSLKFIELYNSKNIKVDEKATVENFEIKSGIEYELMLNKEEIDLIEDILNIFVGENKNDEELKSAENILEKIDKLKNLTTFKRGAK